MAIPAPIYKRISAPNILPPFFSRYIYIITIQKDIKKCKESKNNEIKKAQEDFLLKKHVEKLALFP